MGNAISDLSNWFASVRVQEQATVILSLPGEVEQLADRAGDSIKRTGGKPLSAEPVILDEPDDGGLIGYGVIDIVLSGPRRDDEQGLPWTIAAASECVGISRSNAG